MKSRGLGVAALVLLAGCASSIRHPLDDSEARPPSLEAAIREANEEMDTVGAVALAGARYASSEWASPAGCGINPDYPEQGEVSRVLERSYSELPAELTPSSVLDGVSAHWHSAGYTVSEGSFEEQRVARVHGIGYSTGAVDHRIEMRAFIPCF